MATTRSFNSMLNDYLVYDLLMNELIKRNYVMNKVEIDRNWKGGPLIVPFQGGSASSVSYGSLTAANDVSEFTFARGQVDNYKEIWGTMKWNARDLAEHSSLEGQASGQVSEQSFLRDLPGRLDDFMDWMKMAVSVNLLVGDHFATATADGDASGNITVDHPERFEIDMKVEVDDGNSSPVTGYVNRDKGININTGVINLVTARGGATPVDLSTYTVAQAAKVYLPGATTAANVFTALPSQILSLANGGSANLFGLEKLDYPFLQGINFSGASVTSANVLEKIFDAWTFCNRRGKSTQKEVCVSYATLGACMKLLEVKSGPYRHIETRASMFGWIEIDIIGPKGKLTLAGVQEADDDKNIFLDWGGIKFHTNAGFRVQTDPEGKKYFSVRATTGYEYFVDTVCYGELAVNKANNQGIMYSQPSLAVNS